MESVMQRERERGLNFDCFMLVQIPVYQRGGAIVPQRLRRRRASMLAIHDPITLVIALDQNVRLAN